MGRGPDASTCPSSEEVLLFGNLKLADDTSLGAEDEAWNPILILSESPSSSSPLNPHKKKSGFRERGGMPQLPLGVTLHTASVRCHLVG